MCIQERNSFGGNRKWEADVLSVLNRGGSQQKQRKTALPIHYGQHRRKEENDSILAVDDH